MKIPLFKFFTLALGVMAIFSFSAFNTQKIALAGGSCTYNFSPNSSVFLRLISQNQKEFNNILINALQKNNLNNTNFIINILTQGLQGNNTICFARYINSSQNSIYALQVFINEKEFNQAIEKFSSQIAKTNLGQNKILYKFNNFYFTYIFGSLFGSNDKNTVANLLNVGQPSESLENNKNFTDFKELASGLNNEFLEIFINFKELTKTDKTVSPLVYGLSTEGIVVQETPDGFQAKTHIVFDQNKLSKLGIKPEFYTSFTPELYKKINSNNLIWYEELYNVQENFNNMIKLMENDEKTKRAVEQLEKIFKDATELDFQDDFLSLLKERTAITVRYDSPQWLPAFSIIIEVKNQSDKAQATLKKLENSLFNQLKKTVENVRNTKANLHNFKTEDLISNQKITINNREFNQIILFSPYLMKGSTPTVEEKEKIYLTTGITSDGYLILTTLHNPGTLFDNKGLMANKSFSVHSQDINQPMTEINFLDFKNLRQYVESLNIPFLSNNILEKFLGPLDHIFGITYPWQQNSLLSEVSFQMDKSKLKNYQDLGATLNRLLFLGIEQKTFPTQQNPATSQIEFNDVKKGDWFFSEINNIAQKGIMSGNKSRNDKNAKIYFRPNQNITRAEFISALIAAQNYKGISYSNNKTQTYFKDVSPKASYSTAINQARAYDLIQGYADNTFKPNQSISRAEAMQILWNANPKLKSFQSETQVAPFQDIQAEAWFNKAIKAAYHYELIQGKNPTLFAPNDNLTRAETAKILNRYTEI